MFAVIAPDGTLTIHDQHVTMADVRQAVGPESTAYVWLPTASRLMGWVNDDSQRLYPQNWVGEYVLVTSGATLIPYYGPVVITGYNPRDDWGGPEDLTPEQADKIQGLHRQACETLGAQR